MRRTLTLLASMAFALLLVCGVALAATVSCPTGANGLCVGTAENDTLRGTAGSDDMRGAAGNDILAARGERDKLYGNVGDDVLSGGGGNDTYLFSLKHGLDRIPEGGERGGVDTISYSANVSHVEAWLDRGHVYIYGFWESSRIEFPYSPVIIENLRAGKGADGLFGNEAANSFFGRAGNDRIHGRDGDDFLYGGEGHDRHFGDAHTDTMKGGSGADTYLFERDSWGNDTIVDTTPSDISDVSSGNEVEFSPGLLSIDLVSSADKPEVINTSSGATVNWSGNAVTNVHLRGGGRNNITGSPDANQIITSADGSNNIAAGAGDDVINVENNGDKPDSVDCGEDGPGITDNDTVYADTGDTLIDCETVNP